MASSKPSTNASPDVSSMILYIIGIAGFILGSLMYHLTIKTLLLAVLLYTLTGLSISAGYHRLWAHGSFQASSLISATFALFGSGAFLGSISNWAYLQRAHHRFLDTEKDPTNIKKGFFYAHIGWRFVMHQRDSAIPMKDIEDQSIVRLQHTFYPLLAPLVGLVLPYLMAQTWGDGMGGLIYAGLGRVLIFHQAHFATQSVCHVLGTQSYSDEFSARSFIPVSLFTFGEGYRNYHHNFSRDYRLGPRSVDIDSTKWLLSVLSMFGLVWNLQSTDQRDVLACRVQLKQRKLDKLKQTLNFGPDPQDLPVWTWETIRKKAEAGEVLVVIDGLVHDASKFIASHPGGAKIISLRVGKDSTLGFNGAVYRHSKAARNLLATLRVAKLPKDQIALKIEVDHTHEE